MHLSDCSLLVNAFLWPYPRSPRCLCQQLAFMDQGSDFRGRHRPPIVRASRCSSSARWTKNEKKRGKMPPQLATTEGNRLPESGASSLPTDRSQESNWPRNPDEFRCRESASFALSNHDNYLPARDSANLIPPDKPTEASPPMAALHNADGLQPTDVLDARCTRGKRQTWTPHDLGRGIFLSKGWFRG